MRKGKWCILQASRSMTSDFKRLLFWLFCNLFYSWPHSKKPIHTFLIHATTIFFGMRWYVIWFIINHTGTCCSLGSVQCETRSKNAGLWRLLHRGTPMSTVTSYWYKPHSINMNAQTMTITCGFSQCFVTETPVWFH